MCTVKDDTALRGAAALVGPQAAAILAPAVQGAGGRLHAAVARQVRYDPGLRIAVRYGADVEWADGSRRNETLGALIQAEPIPDGLAVVEGDDGTRIGVWRYPHDPFLPGLPHAAYTDGARRLLASVGVPAEGVVVEPVVYRPGSRAVIRLRARDRGVYVKVVRPHAVGPLRQRHAAFGDRLPVPAVLGWSEPLGLVVLPALAGVPLTRPLVDGGRLPAPREILDLLEGVRATALPRTAAVASGMVDAHARLLQAALPDAGGRIDALAGQAAPLGDDDGLTVHGDFYEGQLLVRDGRITGLLDVDGARRGSAVDDPATLIGHLVGLAHVHPRAARRISAYRNELLRALPADAERLHAAVTGVLLGLATTPFRRQERDWPARTGAWLDLVEAWAVGRLAE